MTTKKPNKLPLFKSPWNWEKNKWRDEVKEDYTDEEWEEKERKEKEDRKRIRRDLARNILQEDPEFLQELIVELRQKKINHIKG